MMFSNTKNVELICQLVRDLREYGALRLERLELDIAQKLAVVVGMLVMGAILFVLALTVVIFASLAAGYALAAYTGSTALAMLIVSMVYLAVALLVYSKRRTWIITPITLFLHELFLSDKKDSHSL